MTGEEAEVGTQPDAERRKGGDGHRPAHALGCRRPMQSGAKCVEHTADDSVVYLVGRQVAIYNYETHSHRFMPLSPKTVEVLAFAVSHNKRYLALSERAIEEKTGELGVQINIFNFATVSRIRTLSLSYLSKQPVETLDFSRDNKYLVTVTNPPEPFIYLWQLDKARLLGMSEVHAKVNQVSISPWAHWTMCTTGPATLRLWRYQDKQLRSLDPTHRKAEWVFTCHAWFDDDKLAVGTQQGDILIIDNCELKRVIPSVLSLSDATMRLNTIYSIGRGLVCGGDGGHFSLFERTYDVDYFQCYKKLVTPHSQTIVDITVSPNEENLICCHDDNELCCFSLSNVDIIDHEKPDEVAQAFRTLPAGFHNDIVTAMDVCVQKSIIVTASLDRYVRIWNFTKKRLEVKKRFPEEALSVSCHPTGNRLLVGFKYKMCMYTVLVDNLHPCQEFPIKQCREVRFSHGGQYFAAVVVNRIFIFNAYTFDPIGHLTGHSSMVKSFCWSKNDQSIISAGFEGAIYEWKTELCKRNESCEYTCKAVSYSAVAYDDQAQLVVAIGSHKVAEAGTPEGEVNLRVLKLADAQDQAPPRATATLGTITSKHSHNKMQTNEVAISPTAQCLFVGTPAGELQVFTWPMRSGMNTPVFTLDLHMGEVLFVLLSVDERFLFTVGEDGCMFMFDVDLLLEGKVPPRRTFNYSIFDDVAFIMLQDIDERTREFSVLQQNLLDEQRTHKHDRESLVAEHAETIDKMKKESADLFATCKAQREDAVVQLQKTQKRMADEAAAVEQQRMQDIQELETLHSRKDKEQTAKYEMLLEEKNDLVVRYENKLHKLHRDHEAERTKHGQELQALQARLEKERDHLLKVNTDSIREAEAVLKDTELEHEEEMASKEKCMQEELEAKEKERLRWQSDVDGHRRRQEKHDQHIKELERDAQERRDKLRKKDAKIAELEKAIQALRLEINVRNDTISASEKKILELKKQTAELEKLRYVLTFKFNELRKEVIPKEDSIRAMNERIEEMDNELERIGTDRDTLQQLLKAKDEKIHVLMKDIAGQHKALDDHQRLIQLVLKDMAVLLSENDGKKVLVRLRETLEKYSVKVQQGEELGVQKMVEFDRQRFYMEAQLAASKKQNIRRESHMKQEGHRKTGEHSLLVREINDLRHQSKALAQKVQVADTQLKETRVQLTQRISLTPIKDKRGGDDRRAESPADLQVKKGANRLEPGKLHRGTTRSLRELAQMDPAKVSEVIQQVEKNNKEMINQQNEIQRLRDFVQHLLKRLQEQTGSGDGVGTDDESM